MVLPTCLSRQTGKRVKWRWRRDEAATRVHATSGAGAGQDGGGGARIGGRVTMVAWPGRHGGDVD